MIGPITTCIDDFIELNMSNYGQDEVDVLQAWAFEALEELKWKHPEWVRLHELADSNRQIIDKLLNKRAWTRAQDVEATSAVHFMLKLGYTYTGAGEWIVLNHDPVIGFDQGEPGGDMTVAATFNREGDKLTLMSIEHSEPPCRHDWCQSSIHDAPDYCTKCGEDKPEFDDV